MLEALAERVLIGSYGFGYRLLRIAWTDGSPEGTTENSPAIHRWEQEPTTIESRRDGRNGCLRTVRIYLSSLAGLALVRLDAQRSIAGLLSFALRAVAHWQRGESKMGW